MNAYELADYIKENYATNNNDIEKVANILRQQADRIAELEKQCEALADEYAIQVNEVCKLFYEIEKITPQTKPLSDEEIDEVIRKHWNREYGNRNMLTLCRAIEERHGIK